MLCVCCSLVIHAFDVLFWCYYIPALCCAGYCSVCVVLYLFFFSISILFLYFIFVILYIFTVVADIKQRLQGATNIADYLKAGGEVDVCTTREVSGEKRQRKRKRV